MVQRKTGFTTVVDLEQFNKMTWSYLTNITMLWQYDGMAYLFREAGIELYGIDRGTMKMNHPIACMALPQSRDKNYGVDIYVPFDKKKAALKLIQDEECVRSCAELEADEGRAARQDFERQALALKAHNDDARKASRARKRAAFISAISSRFMTGSN